MEQFLKVQLGYTFVKRSGQGGGGCISQGEMFNTDQGKIFVKENSKDGARKMFDGEFASLEALKNTNTIRVPNPIMVLERPHGPGALLVMEYLDMRGSNKQARLGEDLARLHMDNIKRKESGENFVEKFGFNTETCCGFLPQGNVWSDNWVDFYTEKEIHQTINSEKLHYLLLQPKQVLQVQLIISYPFCPLVLKFYLNGFICS